MYQITTQPQDVLVNKNEDFSLNVAVEGGVYSDLTTLKYDGNNYHHRPFILRTPTGILYTAGTIKNNASDYEMKTSSTYGYSWQDYGLTIPDYNIPSAGVISKSGDVIIGTSNNSTNQNYIYVNKVLKGYAFGDVLGLVNITGGYNKIGGFYGTLATLNNAKLGGQRADGSWFNYAGLGTDTCPNSWVSTNDGADWLFTLSSTNIGSPNTGVFKVVKDFDNTPTSKLDIRGKLSLCRVSPTRIVAFEFNGAVSAKYSDNNGTTWTDYTNLPPITTMFNNNTLYYDGHCYISSMLTDKTVYHSYMDGAWEAIVISDLPTGSIATAMCPNSAGTILFSALTSTSAEILELNNNTTYSYSLYKDADTVPLSTLTTTDTSFTYNRLNAVISDSGDYYFKIINDGVTLTSDIAVVDVVNEFKIITQPFDQELSEGQELLITVEVTGGDVDDGYTFKVYKDNVLISTDKVSTGLYTYGRTITVLSDAGTYRFDIINRTNTLVSDDAVITIYPKKPEKPTWTHDDSIIIDDSLTNFKLSAIEKCYNEFTVDFHPFLSENLGRVSILKVDEDVFPEYSEDTTVWEAPVTLFQQWTYTGAYYSSAKLFNVILDNVGDATLIADLNANLDKTYRWNVKNYDGSSNNDQTIECDGMTKVTSSTKTTYSFYKTGGTISTPNANFYFYPYSVQKESTAEANNWREFVIGVSDYVTAKELWTKAHTSYVLNSRIRKAPSDRTTLKYAIETAFMSDGVKSNRTDLKYNYTDISVDEYALQYINLLVDWSTRQKLQVDYSVPITTDTIKIELMDNILFTDPIITPEIGEYGKGWVTGIQLDTKKSVIKLSVTFEVLFFVPPMVFGCENWIETGFNVDEAIESGDQLDDAIEGNCLG